MSVLVEAVHLNSLELVKHLCTHGMKYDDAVYYAVDNNNLEMAELLKSYGMNK
jgi:hypothetical protein